MVHRTARLDRRWARCVRRACTAPPYSVWQCLLRVAHRGRHSRTPKPAHCQHVASTPGIGHRLRCCMCSRLLTDPRRGGPRRCSRRRSRRLAQPPPVRSTSVVKQRDACGCRWPHARTRRPAWSRPAFCRSDAGAPPRDEASAACMPGNAGAGVAEPERRLRAGTSPWRSCRRDRAQGKFGGIAETTGNRLHKVNRPATKLRRFATTLTELHLRPTPLRRAVAPFETHTGRTRYRPRSPLAHCNRWGLAIYEGYEATFALEVELTCSWPRAPSAACCRPRARRARSSSC